MSYQPSPIDTSQVSLPEELEELTEVLARNVHDAWALQRMKEGWTWGAERSDAELTHPCLVPYEELSELEKDYDRKTALGTIKLILRLGYRITRDSGDR
jgi:RyR domain-containing protein